MMNHADSLDYNGSCGTEGKALELAQKDLCKWTRIFQNRQSHFLLYEDYAGPNFNTTESVTSFFTTYIEIFIVKISFEHICLHSYSLVMFVMYCFVLFKKKHNNTK